MASWSGSLGAEVAWIAPSPPPQAASRRGVVRTGRGEGSINLHEDREALDAFRRGDEVVLTRIYQVFAPSLGRFLASGFSSARDGRPVRVSISDPAERLDLVHDTFAKAFDERNRLAYDGIHPYGPFLVRIARNLAIDRLRKTRRWSRLVVEDRPVGAESDAPSLLDRAVDRASASPEEDAARGQLAAVFREYLDSLPSQERELMALYHDEASQRTAAQAMGLSRNQIRTLVARVRRGLLTHMQSRGVIRSLDPAELLKAMTLLGVLAGGLR